MMQLGDFDVKVLIQIDGQEAVEVGKLTVPVDAGSVTYTGHGTYYRELRIDAGKLERNIFDMARDLADELAETLESRDHPDQ